MPELPEVQTIVNDLQKITGDTITGFWSNFPKAIKSENFDKEIIGQKIERVRRVGKNVVIELASKNNIMIHLKMTGKLILVEQETCSITQKTRRQKQEAVSKHLHHIFYLKNNGTLEFHDIRKFATLEVADSERLSAIINSKGVDPFSADFTSQKLLGIIKRKKNKNLKSFLMDQSAISGIGNIYASEIPFDAKLSPLKKAGNLTEKEIVSLHKSVLKILTKAIELRGTSFSDYRDASGKKGGFQEYLKVYGKAGNKCSQCDTIIEKSIVQQRSTFHCPNCQK